MLNAFQNRERIGFRVTQFTWPETLGFDLVDFEASIILDGNQYIGRGVDHDQEVALDKAIAEAFERSIAERMPRVSRCGGFAVHQELELALKAARLELIERDAFFCHFLTSTPFIPYLDWRNNRLFQALRNLRKDFSLEFSAHLLAVPENVHCAVVVAKAAADCEYRFGIRLGLGCSDTSKEAALNKAILELLPNLSELLLAEDVHALSAEDLLLLKNPQPIHHARWASHEAAAETLADCLKDGGGGATLTSLNPTQIKTFQLPTPSFWPEGLPLFAVGAQHPIAIRTFCGANNQAIVHEQRLEEFSGKSFFDIKLPLKPHPLG